MKKYLLPGALVLLSVLLAAAPSIALAQSFDAGLNSISGSLPHSGPVGGSTTVTGLIRQIINIALYFTGLIALLFIIYGGYMNITAGGNQEQATKGRAVVTNAVVGIVIIGFSYMIVNVVFNFVQGRT